MSGRFAAEIAYASKELSRIRHDIGHADVAVLSPLTTMRERSAASRAHAYVGLAAVLERVVRDAVQTALREISGVGVPRRNVRSSLFSLLCDPQLASISDRNRQTSWPIRVSVFDSLLSNDSAAFSGDILPLDGRTLRAEHFENVWIVFGLAGPSLPGPHHRFALKDLADGRNNVAHGHIDPVAFGRTKATKDLYSLVGRIDDVVLHLLGAFDAYLNAGGYHR